METFECDICGKLYSYQEGTDPEKQTAYTKKRTKDGWNYSIRIAQKWLPNDSRTNLAECNVCNECREAFNRFLEGRKAANAVKNGGE